VRTFRHLTPPNLERYARDAHFCAQAARKKHACWTPHDIETAELAYITTIDLPNAVPKQLSGSSETIAASTASRKISVEALALIFASRTQARSKEDLCRSLQVQLLVAGGPTSLIYTKRNLPYIYA
jgi:hypothetical protein